MFERSGAPRRDTVRGTGLALALAGCLAAAACRCPDERMADLRAAWDAGDARAAEREADALLLGEAEELDPALLTHPRALVGRPALREGDACLYLLEKAMARLASGDADGAIDLLRAARDVLDERFVEDLGDAARQALSLVADDTVLEYRGQDSDHVLLRVWLALCDLVTGGGDALAYAHQVGEMQERILGSEFSIGEYNPREHYRRVALGAYLEGVLREAELSMGEAEKAYLRALEYGGPNPIVQAALERVRSGRHTKAGWGAVHVFRLVGRGPFLVQGTHEPTDLAMRLATLLVAATGKRYSALMQTSVPVPVVVVRDPSPPWATVRADGVASQTFPVLDVNAVALQQNEALLPWIMARAVARRALKAIGASLGEQQARQQGPSQDLAFALASLASIIWTAVECADTRCWSTLPAQVQVARFELPEGEHLLQVSGASLRLRTRSGHDTYVLVVEPIVGSPSALYVDPPSRVSPAP